MTALWMAWGWSSVLPKGCLPPGLLCLNINWPKIISIPQRAYFGVAGCSPSFFCQHPTFLFNSKLCQVVI